MDVPETPLQQAERHVVESQDRIERQQHLARELEADHHFEMHAAALKLLRQMGEFHRIALDHVRSERAKRKH